MRSNIGQPHNFKNFNATIDRWISKGFRLFSCSTLIIVAAIGMIILSIAWNITGGSQSLAQKEAEKYAANIPGVTNIECNRYDSDSDGYVSCTLFRGRNEPKQIECGWGGCRVPKMVVNRE